MEYKRIENDYLSDHNEEVNQLLKDGWELLDEGMVIVMNQAAEDTLSAHWASFIRREEGDVQVFDGEVTFHPLTQKRSR